MTTNEKKKYLFSKLLPILEDFGFSVYKGRMWCYRPEQEFLYYVDCTFTRWGTLNDILIGFGSFCSPIRYGKTKQSLSVGNFVSLCQQIRIKHGVSVYAMYGAESDEIFIDQINKLLPYLCIEFERIFEKRYISDLLEHMRTLSEMQRLVPIEFALFQYRLGDIETALEFLRRRKITCKREIDHICEIKSRFSEERFFELYKPFKAMFDEIDEYAIRIKQNDPELSAMINERINASASLCESFFHRFKKK